jgi:FkbM family methyltransferase
MTKIERIIHFTVPSQLTEKQSRAIERARELHPDWVVMVWRDPIDAAGFRLANYHGSANSGAQLADLIRLDVILRYGGVYLDSDVFLQKSLLPLLELDNFFCSEDGQNLTNAVFAASKGHPLIERLILDLVNNEPDWKLPPNQTTGPVFFSRVLHWQKSLNLLPRDTFYPYNWNEKPIAPLPTTYGIHEWAGSWLNKSTKNSDPKKKSWIYISIASTKFFLKKKLRGILLRIARVMIADVKRSIGAYSFGHDLITRTNRGIYISLAGADLSITPEIALNLTYEERELKFLEKYLKGGDFFVDIGCNVGIFSLTAAKCVGPFGRVYAIDANSEILVHLKRSLVMNWVHDRTIVMNNAVGAWSGEVVLQYSEQSLGGANVGLSSESAFNSTVELIGNVNKKKVSQVRLDDIFPFNQEIKILKIDVEGSEYGVLQGADRLIGGRSIDFILLELLEEISADKHELNIAAVLGLIDRGYVTCSIDDYGNLCKETSLNSAMMRSRNIVLARH